MQHPPPSEETAIRSAIRREFVNRSQKNPAYSLRSFANFLELDQSFLSKILKGDRRITPAVAKKMGLKLSLPASGSPEPARAENGGAFNRITDDAFFALAEWHHFAILELAKTRHRTFSPAFVAQRLGLHEQTAVEALERLERLGLLTISRGRARLLSSDNSWTSQTNTTEARKHYQRQLLEKAAYALDHVPFAERDHGSVTVAVCRSRIPELKERLAGIRRQLAAEFQRPTDRALDAVYQVTIAFFPLTQPLPEEP